MPTTSPLRLKQRPSRVARVHRRVGLDERDQVLLRQIAALGADDPRCHRVLQPERLADGHHPFAHLELVRITNGDLRQVFRFDLQQRDIGTLVDADHLGLEFPLVGQLDVHLVGTVDDMRIGDEIAIARDDETGTDGLLLQLALGRAAWPRNLAEAPEELVERVVLGELESAGTSDLLRHVDRDHRRTLFVVELGEVGQPRGGAYLRGGRRADARQGCEKGPEDGCGQKRTIALNHVGHASALDNGKRSGGADGTAERIPSVAPPSWRTAGW